MTFYSNTADEPNGTADSTPYIISVVTSEFAPSVPGNVKNTEMGRIEFTVDEHPDSPDFQVQTYRRTTRELGNAFTQLGEQWTKIADAVDEEYAKSEDA